MRRSRAAEGAARDRLPQFPLTRGLLGPNGWLSARPCRAGLHRGRESGDRGYRWARGDYERLPALAADLVGKPVRVLATVGGEISALAAKGATSTIPIVFSMGDPVQLGLVESYNRPGETSRASILCGTELETKRIGLLHDLVPQATTIGFLVNAAFSGAKAEQRAMEEAAHALKLQVLILSANSDGEIEKAFETTVEQHVGALAIGGAAFFDTRRAKLLALQSQYRLPTAYQFREYAAEGGVMSYGPNSVDAYRQVALYVGRILKGEKPADLPVIRPTKFDLVINLKTAKALGLTVPHCCSPRRTRSSNEPALSTALK